MKFNKAEAHRVPYLGWNVPMQLYRLEADSLESNFEEEDLCGVMVILLDDKLTVRQPKNVNSILSWSRKTITSILRVILFCPHKGLERLCI